MPISQISLPITFRKHDSFWTEKVIFDVVNIKMVYNTILGRPTLAKFMAAARYAYQCVKILGPKGSLPSRVAPR